MFDEEAALVKNEAGAADLSRFETEALGAEGSEGAQDKRLQFLLTYITQDEGWGPWKYMRGRVFLRKEKKNEPRDGDGMTDFN